MERAGYRYEGYIILASLLWGTSFVSAKIGVGEIDPFFYSFLRFLIGSSLLLVIVLATRSYEPRLFKDKIIWGIAFVNAVAYNFQHVGISMTTATNAALLVDINAVFVAILAVFILGERLNYRIGLGLVLGISGVVIVTPGQGDMGPLIRTTVAPAASAERVNDLENDAGQWTVSSGLRASMAARPRV